MSMPRRTQPQRSVLTEMRLRGVGIIDEAVLTFHPGLTVLTGETGAGKTMVVTGLGWLLGGRGDSTLVRTGTAEASVEGIITVPGTHPAMIRALDAGAVVDDDELVLVRSVSAEGRSRAHVGGRTVPIGVLADIAENLVAVHGQADQWRLRQPEQHREVLDAFGGEAVASPAEAYSRLHDELRALRGELERLSGLAGDRSTEIAVLTAGLELIEEVDPQPGEDESLRVEAGRLAHAEGLRSAAEEAHVLLTGPDDVDSRSMDGSSGVMSGLGAAAASMRRVGDDDPEALRLASRLTELGHLATDVASELASYAAGVELDPARLEAVQQRRADLARVLRAHGPTIADALEWSRTAAVRLDELLTADDRRTELRQRESALLAELAEAAVALSRARAVTATSFAEAVSSELANLSMATTRVHVEVSQRDRADGLLLPDGRVVAFGPAGIDDVELQLATDPGGPGRTIARTASGGELSRVMLAIEVVLGDVSTTVPTFVFDEIDAGIGGSAALDVGARLAALAAHAQVICVTHLAQVAAHADRHLVVRRSRDGQVQASDIVEVGGDERLAELARMMSGGGSEAALDHARDLLSRTRHATG